LARPVELL